MIVKIIAKTTDSPLSFVGSVAGMSYGKGDPSRKRAVRCLELGHMSVFEHVSATWRIEGISRACSHQLVRHRLASYCQLSQRYVKVDTGEDWYVKPPIADYSRSVRFDQLMELFGNHYKYLINAGMKPEDARYVLPEATKTNINVTMNMREFASFYALRADKAAQWEIRGLAEEMLGELQLLGGEWKDLTELIEEVCDED